MSLQMIKVLVSQQHGQMWIEMETWIYLSLIHPVKTMISITTMEMVVLRRILPLPLRIMERIHTDVLG